MWDRGEGSRHAGSERGLTLVELLVTVVVLGVVSSVVVVAVGGIRAQSQASACAADRAALETAEEAHNAQFGAYATEAELVAASQLRDESSLHDVVLGAGDYEITPTGACAEGGAVEAAGTEPEPTSTTAPPTTSTTLAPTTTTTVAPTTTTTTRPLRALTLSAPCTPRSHWPDERAWQVRNRNAVPVTFTLEAVNATSEPGHRIEATAPSGNSTWYLPAASWGRSNTAELEALDVRTSRTSGNRRC